ncbi:MAG TPA: polyprenyl synthetase family protein [Blastocatellia bacterium]|nr:polyprenyl synthetase family protein [Blastocatellia bacterium]
MTDSLSNFIADYRPAIETALEAHLPLSTRCETGRLNEALRYAVFPGGKRWRPMFTLLGALLVGGAVKRALPAACAVEFLHTSSLILDDLPVMDDAELRRGRAALHVAYGEGMALLASLALLNQSYSLLACAARDGADAIAASRLICEATRCIGSNGMIGGQVADIEMRSTRAGAEALASRNLKTTALTRLMMTSGAIAVGAAENEIAALAHFGESLGAAYQVYDDVLDELGECESLGKTVRQDARHARPSFVAELGIEGACRLAASLIEEGKSALAEHFADCPEVSLLSEAADCIIGGAVNPATALVQSGS